MRTVTRVCVIAGVCLVVARPAAAQQDPAWARELEAQVKAAIEAAAPHIEAMADAVARAVEDQIGQPPRPPRPPRVPGPNTRGDRRGPEVTEQFSRTLKLPRNGTLDLANTSGDVTITGRGGDEIRIDATKRMRGSSEENARAALKDLTIDVTERGGVVEVRTEYPQQRNFRGSVDYVIALPTGSNVTVKTVSGDLHITNVRGEVRAETVSGDVEMAMLGRLRSVRALSGDITITGAEGEDVTGNTLSGTFAVRGLKARSVDLESVSGDFRFMDSDCERLNLKTISGDIEYNGRLARNGHYELQSHSGDITVTPVGSPGFDIEATTFSGDVRSDFGVTVRGAGNSLVGRGPGRTVRGSFGDASAILSLRSFSGDIVISK